MEDLRTLDLPRSAGDGAPKEVRVIDDNPHLKLVLVILRRGAVLPEHSTPMPITLQALSGSGTVRVGDRAEPLGPGRLVLVAPGASHEVTAAAETDLVVLLHQVKAARHGGERPWTGELG